ncbi:MAG: hypothetical protein M0C28_44400 [Candidatus Moduliflexus flocculans]|nr:hypothetical protein [Candidatus Moduliflexus flocculans]
MIAEAARAGWDEVGQFSSSKTPEPIVDWLKANLTSKDVVLIKGSHGLRMDRIIAALEVRS